jgi:hypothetical protein
MVDGRSQLSSYELFFPEQAQAEPTDREIHSRQEKETGQVVGTKLIKGDGRVIMDNSFTDRLFSIHCPWPSSLLTRNVSFS